MSNYINQYQELVKRLCIAYHKKDSKEIATLVYALSCLHDEIKAHLTQVAGDGAVCARESAEYHVEWIDAETIRLTPRA